MLKQELKKALAREPSDLLGHFNAGQWLKALRQSRDLDAEPSVPSPAGVPPSPSLVRALHFGQLHEKGLGQRHECEGLYLHKPPGLWTCSSESLHSLCKVIYAFHFCRPGSLCQMVNMCGVKGSGLVSE